MTDGYYAGDHAEEKDRSDDGMKVCCSDILYIAGWCTINQREWPFEFHSTSNLIIDAIISSGRCLVREAVVRKSESSDRDDDLLLKKIS